MCRFWIRLSTTTFNAAFFAGLDIPEHKAHSIYISRYPFGREATLAYIVIIAPMIAPMPREARRSSWRTA